MLFSNRMCILHEQEQHIVKQGLEHYYQTMMKIDKANEKIMNKKKLYLQRAN
jgi:hypothetical protein